MVYRPPRGTDLSPLFEEYQSCAGRSGSVIIAGDFNCHSESVNKNSKAALELIKKNQLHLVHSAPTFFRVDPPSWLDTIVVDDPIKLVKVETSGASYIGSHDYVFVEYRLENIKVAKSVRCRDFRDMRPYKVQRDLTLITAAAISDLQQTAGINISYDNFKHGLLNVLDKHAPFKLIRLWHPSKAFVSSELSQ